MSTKLRTRLAVVVAALIPTAIAVTTLALSGPGTSASASPLAPLAAKPTVYEQAAVSQDVALSDSAATVVAKSPVIPKGNYLITMVIQLSNIPPGGTVLCGVMTTTSVDFLTGTYGNVSNEGSAAGTDNCVVTGTAKIKAANDHFEGWAGPGSDLSGTTVLGWSMNELPVGKLVLTTPSS
jgi:hypothetical protein